MRHQWLAFFYIIHQNFSTIISPFDINGKGLQASFLSPCNHRLCRPDSTYCDVNSPSWTSLLGLLILLLHKLGIFDMLPLNIYFLFFVLPFLTPYGCFLSTLSTNESFLSKILIPIKLFMLFLLFLIPINDDAFRLALLRCCCCIQDYAFIFYNLHYSTWDYIFTIGTALKLIPIAPK